ncbi:MAG: AMP-binding protein [Thermoanaerobaculia bacterium]|nr:AMP-binding protein [Thermoanaerobaculia bacterium]
MAETVLDVLERAAGQHPRVPALKEKQGNGWGATSWEEYRDRVLTTARGFLALGLEPGGGVAILGANCPRWFLSDLGAIAAGGVPVGIYTTSTSDQATWVARHAEAQIAVVQEPSDLAQLQRDRLPDLKAVVLMEGTAPGRDVLSWAELEERAEDAPETELESRMATQGPDDVCTLIYTSGTTGRPKGVMLTHRNIVWTAGQIADAFDLTPGESVISYLPLSHIAEQIVSLHGPMAVAGTTWFAESLDRLGENLREVRPHVFFGVPRVWEKIQARMQAVGSSAPAWKRRLSAWARRIGLRGGYAEQRGERRPLLYPLANRLVFRTVRERLGLDRARVCSTSAAPIALDTLEFFLSLGIPLLEVYGMSECTGPTTLSLPDRYRTGKAGFAIPGTDLRIGDDGEILMRGPHVFAGYFKNPEATAETVDSDGWIHSGDVGTLDEDGFLEVTDRMKELLITSGGKNVAPQPIEARLKSISGVGQAVVVGDRRKYLSALLVLDEDNRAETAERAGSPARTLEEASSSPEILAHLQKEIEEINRDLARYETIKRFSLLPEPLTVESGELTPTMKLKRRVIRERRAEGIDELYEED